MIAYLTGVFGSSMVVPLTSRRYFFAAPSSSSENLLVQPHFLSRPFDEASICMIAEEELVGIRLYRHIVLHKLSREPGLIAITLAGLFRRSF